MNERVMNSHQHIKYTKKNNIIWIKKHPIHTKKSVSMALSLRETFWLFSALFCVVWLDDIVPNCTQQ